MNKPCNNCKFAKSYQYPNGRIKYCCGKTYLFDCEKYKKYKEYLENRKKYQKGKQIKSVQEYLTLKDQGQTLFYWNNCIRHFAVLENMQFRLLVSSIQNGYVFNADKKIQ